MPELVWQSIGLWTVCVCGPQIYDFLSIVFNAFIEFSERTAGGDNFVHLKALSIVGAN